MKKERFKRGYLPLVPIILFFGILFLFTQCKKDKQEVVKPKIAIATVRGPERNPADQCGGFQWDVTFTLDEASAKGGWFVQKIIFKSDFDPCDNNEINILSTYWEAWEVKPGKKIENERDQGNFDYDDRYSMPDRPDHKGKNSIKGDLNFFEELDLPAEFIANNPNTFAGALRATTNKPDFWKDEGNLDHDINVDWNCCSPAKTKDVKSVPAVVENKPAPEADKSSLNSLAQVILDIPAWTNVYTSSENLNLTEIASEVSSVPTPNLQTAIQQILDAVIGTKSEIEDLSKVYLLLRSIFQLPNNAPRSNVKVFGGWINPEVLKTDLPNFNLSWPIVPNIGSTGITLQVVGQFAGYLGKPYDAIGELLFFEENYPRRAFVFE